MIAQQRKSRGHQTTQTETRYDADDHQSGERRHQSHQNGPDAPDTGAKEQNLLAGPFIRGVAPKWRTDRLGDAAQGFHQADQCQVNTKYLNNDWGHNPHGLAFS